MTKSQQIMALYDGKRSTKEIAEIVGCRPEYVRVVARQRQGHASDHDRKYKSSQAGREVDRQWREKNRSRLNAQAAAYFRVILETGDGTQARRKARAAYAAARAAGKSIREATGLYCRTYRRVLRETGNSDQARAARAAYASETRLEAAE